MIALLQTTTGGSVEGGTTVYLHPDQMAQLAEQMQGNTWAVIGWIAFCLLNLGAIAMMMALSGR